MQNLNKREDILITKAGKGGAVVIVDVKDYIKEAEWLLTNIKNYSKLQKNPTTTNKYIEPSYRKYFKICWLPPSTYS